MPISLKHVFWATGFRPFFLLAALMAMVWPALWMLVLFNQLVLQSWLGPIGWHGHEMIFGFTVAVLAGFLLTATQAWTRQSTASRGALGLLVALWVGGRAALLLPPSCAAVAAAIDVMFLPLLAWFCGRPVFRTRNWRNLAFAPLLLLMALCNLALHLEGLGVIVGWRLAAQNVALTAVLLIVAIVGGRIIPLFTGNALPAAQIRQRGWIDRVSLYALCALLVAHATPVPGRVVGIVAIAAGLLHLLRMRGWGTWGALRRPILAVLHVGYGWLPVGLLFSGVSQFVPGVASAAGLHALTAGAIATLVIGMISRVALGHTGRPLRVGKAMTLGYLCVTVAALLRVGVPLLAPSIYRPSLLAVTALWIAAFAIYLAGYWKVLTVPRVDGKPG